MEDCFLCCPQLLFLSKPFLGFFGCLWPIVQPLARAPKMVQIGPICQAGGGQMDTNRSLNGLDLSKMIKNRNDLRDWYSNRPIIKLNGWWLQTICVIWNLHNPMDNRKKRGKWCFEMKVTASSLVTTVSITVHKAWRFQDCVLSRGRPRRLDTFSEICWVIQYLTPKQLALAVTKVTPYIWLSGQCELDKGPVGHICPSSYS